MSRKTWWIMLALPGLLGLAAATPSRADRDGLAVELWTDRGTDAVYQPGQAMEIRTRVSDDAYLLVYEIDTEGYVRTLFPFRGSSGFVEGGRTYEVPPENADVQLVVQGPTGQGYVVAIVSRDRFHELPWYLRPYDPQAEGVGYEGVEEEEEGITREGRIVGDPFVAMERIRRRVLESPDDEDAFASGYTAYYVHREVRYPRYVCYDCHRPNRWAWWDGFDPYYTHCSVIDFRVNWGWGWGPGYWFGNVPYYYYVFRNDCPPRYRAFSTRNASYSSWDGWSRWRSLWGGRLTRFKSDPPSGYVPPSAYKDRNVGREGKPMPPGFLVRDDQARVRPRGSAMVPSGRHEPARGAEAGNGRSLTWRGREGRRPPVVPDGVRRSGESEIGGRAQRPESRDDHPWMRRPPVERPPVGEERGAIRPQSERGEHRGSVRGESGRREDGRRAAPQRVGPRREDGRRAEPQRAGPRRDDGHRAEPQKAEPRRDDGHRDEPQKAQPRRDDGHRDEPQKAEPRRQDSRPTSGNRGSSGRGRH